MEKKNMKTMHAKDMHQTSVMARITGVIAKIFTYLFLFVMALIVLFPFYWMIISSLKTETEYRQNKPTFIPKVVETYEYFAINTNLETGNVAQEAKAPVETYEFNNKVATLVHYHNEKNGYYLGINPGETNFSVTNLEDITGDNAGNLGVTRFPARFYEVTEEGVAKEFVDNPRTQRPYKLGAQIADGTVLYFNGKTEAVDGGYRLSTTTNPEEAVTVMTEGSRKACHLYFEQTEGEGEAAIITKQYIRSYHIDTGKLKYPLLKNYVEAFKQANLGDLFLHTAYVGIVSTLLSLVITVLSAFAFARLEFKGKDTLFAALLATMMIPGELFTITNYITIDRLDWLNTYYALIVPFLVSVFYIYLLRQNFLQIPNELYLAAKVDGTSDLKYLWKVMVPLALPTLISITILKMMGAWNTYIWPKLVANDDAHKLITNGLRNAFTSDATNDTTFTIQMAAVVVVSAPLFMVFLFLRKYIMAGVSRSGIKG